MACIAVVKFKFFQLLFASRPLPRVESKPHITRVAIGQPELLNKKLQSVGFKTTKNRKTHPVRSITTTGRLQRNAESSFSILRRERAVLSPGRLFPKIGVSGGSFSPTRGGRDRKEGRRQDRAILSGTWGQLAGSKNVLDAW